MYSSNGFTFTTFFDADRVDGANLLRATLTGFASSWYKFLPNLAPGISRAILNMIYMFFCNNFLNIALKENCQVKNGMVISKDYSLHNLNW